LIIDTDYVNYSLVYSCRVAKRVKYNYAWILSREKVLNEEIVENLINKLSSFGIDKNDLIKTDQTDCELIYE
jgi:lipocalin